MQSRVFPPVSALKNKIMAHPSTTRAFVIAAPSSGCGKTTITMGLIAALRRRGLTVQPFKVGPDYIDSAYHSALAERICINLDSWMSSPDFVRNTFDRHCSGADVAIIEGVMGLFDGTTDGKASTAQIAELLNLPVLHVINAAKSAQTAAAVLRGMECFDPDLQTAGAIFNGIASPSHWESVEAASNKCSSQSLGYLPKCTELALPERQLGLVSAHEHGLPESYITRLVEAVEEHIDIDTLLENAVAIPTPAHTPEKKTPRVRLGIAKDEAFCFYYQDNLDLLEQEGIELVEFSPMNDTSLPNDLGGLYFGGGFPEEFTEKLAQNKPMLDAVRNFKGSILAECGGLIYLTTPLARLIDGTIEMTDKLQACGYREVTFNRDTILGRKGTSLRGHEFHWSTWISKPAKGYGALQTGERAWGYADMRILASYFHIYFASNPAAIESFRENLDRTIDDKTIPDSYEPAEIE